jgi:hypothetical protein
MLLHKILELTPPTNTTQPSNILEHHLHFFFFGLPLLGAFFICSSVFVLSVEIESSPYISSESLEDSSIMMISSKHAYLFAEDLCG